MAKKETPKENKPDPNAGLNKGHLFYLFLIPRL